MATGYDNRQSIRQSFAFAPKPGAQTQNAAAATPTIGRSGLAGEMATGGNNVIMSQNPVSGAGAGAQIPEFINTLLEPHLKAQQERRVREGYAAAVNGASMDSINERQPGLSAIFGPTDFQRGAQFFNAQQAVNNWSTEQINNLPALAQLPPEDLPRVLNAAAEAHMTGDVFADNAINASILEQQATLIPRIAQARAEWEQRTLRTGARNAAISAGSAYGALVNSYTTQPDAPETGEDPLAGQRVDVANVVAQKTSFLSSFLPVDGMTREAHQGFVEESYQAFLAENNLWAFNAMAEGGANSLLFQTLGAEKYAQAQAAYRTAGARAVSQAMMTVGPEYDRFRTQVRLGQVSPEDVRAKLQEFNTRVASLTGYLEPAFDGEAIVTQVEGRVDDLVSGLERDEGRAYQEHRDVVNRAATEEAKQQQEQQETATALSLIAQGDIQAAKFLLGESKVNILVTSAIRTDASTTIPFLISSHRNSSEVVSGARDILQSQVQANIGAGYDSESFQTAYRNWQTFNQVEGGGAARAAYYGNFDPMFLRMQTLMANGSGITGTLAYAQTFGEAGALAGSLQPAAAPSGERATKLEAAVTAIGPGFFQRNFGGQRQTLSATDTIFRLARGGASARMDADPNLSEEEALRQEVSALVADRRLEQVGNDAWANPTRGAPMADLTRVPSERLGAVWQELVDQGRDRVGARGRPYTVWRSGTGTATRWLVAITPRNGGDAEVFDINVGQITAWDTVRERRDVERRRESFNRNQSQVDRNREDMWTPLNRDGPTPHRARTPDPFAYDTD